MTVAGTLLLLGGGCLLVYGLLGILPLLLVLVGGNVLGSLLVMLMIATTLLLALATSTMGIIVLCRRTRGIRTFTMIVAALAIAVEVLGLGGYLVLALGHGEHLPVGSTFVTALLIALPSLAHSVAFGLLAKTRAS